MLFRLLDTTDYIPSVLRPSSEKKERHGFTAKLRAPGLQARSARAGAPFPDGHAVRGCEVPVSHDMNFLDFSDLLYWAPEIASIWNAELSTACDYGVHAFLRFLSGCDRQETPRCEMCGVHLCCTAAAAVVPLLRCTKVFDVEGKCWMELSFVVLRIARRHKFAIVFGVKWRHLVVSGFVRNLRSRRQISHSIDCTCTHSYA